MSRRIAAAAAAHTSCHLSACALPWGSRAAVQELLQHSRPTLVTASDLVYFRELFAPLLRTLLWLTDGERPPTVMVGYKTRAMVREEQFWKAFGASHHPCQPAPLVRADGVHKDTGSTFTLSSSTPTKTNGRQPTTTKCISSSPRAERAPWGWSSRRTTTSCLGLPTIPLSASSFLPWIWDRLSVCRRLRRQSKPSQAKQARGLSGHVKTASDYERAFVKMHDQRLAPGFSRGENVSRHFASACDTPLRSVGSRCRAWLAQVEAMLTGRVATHTQFNPEHGSS